MNKTTLENIVRYRKRAGLSQSEMADKLNITQTAYSKLELGKTKLSEFYLFKIASILNLQPDELIDAEYLKNYKIEGLTLNSDKEEIRSNLLFNKQQQIDNLENLLHEKEKHIEALYNLIKDKEKIIGLLEKELGKK